MWKNCWNSTRPIRNFSHRNSVCLLMLYPLPKKNSKRWKRQVNRRLEPRITTMTGKQNTTPSNRKLMKPVPNWMNWKNKAKMLMNSLQTAKFRRKNMTNCKMKSRKHQMNFPLWNNRQNRCPMNSEIPSLRNSMTLCKEKLSKQSIICKIYSRKPQIPIRLLWKSVKQGQQWKKSGIKFPVSEKNSCRLQPESLHWERLRSKQQQILMNLCQKWRLYPVRPERICRNCVTKPVKWAVRQNSVPPKPLMLWTIWQWQAGKPMICSAVLRALWTLRRLPVKIWRPLRIL